MSWIMRTLFLRRFARALKRQSRWAPTRRDLMAEMAALPGAGHMQGADRQAAFNLLLAQSLQAAVRGLQGRGYGRNRAIAMARDALLETGAGVTRALFGWWLRFAPDPVAQMKARRNLADKARKLWGQGMLVTERHGPDEVALIVHDCPFATYFWNVAEPDLTPILCAFDAQWMAQVNRSGRPVTVSRAGTLAAGEAACEFTFTRMPDERRAAILRAHPLNMARKHASDAKV